MIVKPLTAEIALSTANDVSLANRVRIYNDTAGAVLITNTVTGGSFTMPAGSIVFLEKNSVETLTASAAVKATSVAIRG